MGNILDGKVEFLCPQWSQYQGLNLNTLSCVCTVVPYTPGRKIEASPVPQPYYVILQGKLHP